MLSRISGLLNYLSEILKNQIFVRQKVTIENTMAYVRSIFEFGIMIHLFSCLWIFIGALNDEWMENEKEIFFEKKAETYVDALYFITTTMTQVGYGDISAFGKGSLSMIFVSLVQFFGILGFAIIKLQVFSAKSV